MVRRGEELYQEKKSNPLYGKGEILVRSLLNGPEEMYDKGRVFAHTAIYPDLRLGYHVYENESETYYILSRVGRFNDSGKIRIVKAGDVTFTGYGEGHSPETAGEGPLEVIALILYKNQKYR